VLLETAQNAHNDIVMVLLLLVALWLLLQTKSTLTALPVLPLVALAFQIKFVPLLVAPAFILALTLRQKRWGQRLIALGLHTLLFVAFAVLPLLPLWPGWDNWGVISFNSGAGRSPLALLILALRPLLGINLAFELSRGLLNICFLLVGLWVFWRNHRRLRQPETVILFCWAAFFWYVALAIPVFHAWYLLWALPFAILLLPETKYLLATLTFTLTALLIIPYFETVRLWFPILLQNHLLGHAVGVPLLVLPPILMLGRQPNLIADG
jgi:hypothetical protein